SQASGNTGSTTAEPAYVKLAVIQNDNGAADYPIGAIGVWTGLLSAVPAGYVVCDGSGGTVDTRGKFVKVADALGNIGGTGGSTTHDHTDPSAHTHTTAHQHATLTGAASAFVTGFVDGTGTVGITNAHVHAGTSAASSASASGNGTQTVDAAAHDPPHLTVVHVKYTGAMSVNITSPTEGQTVSNPGLTVTWTLSDSVSGVQATRRVRVYAANQSTLVHDSGTAATSSLSYALPTTIGLSNLTTYYVRVDGTDTNGLPGISAFVGFVTSWTAPGTVGGLTLTPIGGV
ncbi:MAG: Ig-like domain-containing protein, partial [Dehalococcoidia bacterium]